MALTTSTASLLRAAESEVAAQAASILALGDKYVALEAEHALALASPMVLSDDLVSVSAGKEILGVRC